MNSILQFIYKNSTLICLCSTIISILLCGLVADYGFVHTMWGLFVISIVLSSATFISFCQGKGL